MYTIGGENMSEEPYTYRNKDLGSALRNLRGQYHISQEDLCRGIMSPTKLSRIETGKDLPSDQELALLMDRLHEPGCLLSDLYSTPSAETRRCLYKLKTACAFDRWEQVGQLLWCYRELAPETSLPARQFIQFTDLLSQRYLGASIPPKDWVNYCISILKLTCPNYLPSANVSELQLNQQEILILNAIAVGLMEWDMIRQSKILLLQLLNINRNRQDMGDLCALTRIALENNLLLCELKGPFHGKALELCRNLLAHCSLAGGTYFYCKALRTRRTLLLDLGQEQAAAETERVIFFLYHQLPTYEKIPYKDFIQGTLEILLI